MSSSIKATSSCYKKLWILSDRSTNLILWNQMRMLRKGKVYVPCKLGYVQGGGCEAWRVSPLSAALSWRISLVSRPSIPIKANRSGWLRGVGRPSLRIARSGPPGRGAADPHPSEQLALSKEQGLHWKPSLSAEEAGRGEPPKSGVGAVPRRCQLDADLIDHGGCISPSACPGQAPAI
jgi:hypothetical protein